LTKQLCALALVFCFFVPWAECADLTIVSRLGIPDIAVYEVTGDYDAELTGGLPNASARQAVAREFYANHPDDYDFLVIFTNFDFRMPQEEAVAFYHEVKNDVQGIGKELFDNTSLYGSDGRLQGIIDMGNINSLASDPLDPAFSETMGILSHELLHRWAAEVTFRSDDNSISDDLLGREGHHWSFLLDTGGSLEYGNQWVDNGNGTFTSLAGRRYFSPLDMYLMGMLDKSEVPPMLLIDNPDVDPERLPQAGVTIDGTPQYVSIDQIIAAGGERIPGVADARKAFRMGCLYLTRPGTYSEADLQAVRTIITSWVMWFSGLTNGRGKVVVDDSLPHDLPANPGPVAPVIDPRSTPAEINEGVAWLLQNQQPDGSWQDSSLTAGRDTAAVLEALADFPEAVEASARGMGWLAAGETANLDYLARKIKLLGSSGSDAPDLTADMLARQNPDGGWGNNRNYESNPADTALALQAITAAGGGVAAVSAPAVSYLLAGQNDDGGWGPGGRSTIQATIEVMAALLPFREQNQLDRPLGNALTWVYARQNPDGGFGDSPSTVYATAQTLLALKKMGIASPAAGKALKYILDRQGQDGGWLASPYQTALAVKAVWSATREPDLSVSTEEIIPVPDPVSLLPADLRLSVTVRNSGMSEVGEAEVVLYEGAASEAGLIGRKMIAVAGNSSETVVFDTSITDGRPHHYFVVVDPDDLVREASKQNNSALRIVYPESTYDFAVSAEEIFSDPAAGSVYDPLAVSVIVRNNGTVDAFDVPLQLTVDRGAGPMVVAGRTVDLPAGQAVNLSLTWVPEIFGAGIPLSVIIDPHNAFAEVAEDNNTATITLDINGSDKPDLSLSHTDISFDPVPALEGGAAFLKAIVRNRGFSPATVVQVDFYESEAGGSANTLLGTVMVPEVAPGGSAEAILAWENIPVSGKRTISAVLDPQHAVEEISKNNNSAFAGLRILALPDLFVTGSEISFHPGAPHEGEQVTVSAVVRNSGEQAAENIPVIFRAGNEVLGSVLIGEIAAEGWQTASAPFDTTGKVGIAAIEVIVDPNQTIQEQDRSNNGAVRSIGIQNADLWLSNSYISPNGDGVQDAAQFGCRLEMPQDVTVAVVNEDAEVVRKFSGPDFIDTAYVSLTWDGLDGQGRVVADGQYQLQVRAESEAVLATLQVTVDTNRSSLLRAIGSPYLYQSEIHQFLADNRWIWLPDESGILFHLATPNEDIPAYSTGLYTMSPTGGNIVRLVPWEWNIDSGEETGYRFRTNSSDCNPRRWSEFFPSDQVNPGFSLARDGVTLAFILERYNKASGQIEASQLWTVSRFGSDLALRASFEGSGEQQKIITDIFWSPDGSHIAFKSFDRIAGRHAVTIIRENGTETAAIVPEWTAERGDDYGLYWSPDSSRIAFAESGRIVVADLAGNLQEVMPVGDQGTFINWLSNGRLLVRDLGGGSWLQTVWIVDLDSGAEPLLVGRDLEMPNGVYDSRQCIRAGREEYNTPVMESGHFLAAIDWSNYPYLAYTICGADGVCREAPILDYWWSNFALSPGSTSMVHSFYDGLLEVYDLETGETDIRVIGDYACFIDWELDYPDLPSVFNILPLEGECDRRAFMEVVRWNWLDDTTFLAYYSGTPEGVIAYDFETGKKTYLPAHWQLDQLLLSPGGRYISYAAIYDRTVGRYGTVTVNGSLLNLTADLRPMKTDSAVILQGTAADLNFAGWMLEYADRKTPDDWHIITPSVEKPVVNDVMATWIPPYEGSFLVRLTVTDLAGNTGLDRRLVTWGKKFSVTDIRKTGDLLSPNGDGVKDTVSLQYIAHEPVHLELSLHDQGGSLIRTFDQDHALPGQYGIVWDGRDEAGAIVADGYYSIRIFDYEFFVQVDSTPPDALLEFTPLACGNRPAPAGELFALALDKNLKSWTMAYGEGDAPGDWYAFSAGENLLAETTPNGEIRRDEAGDPLPAVVQIYSPVTSPAIGFPVGKTYRLTAEDLAGNRSIVDARMTEELVVLSGWDGSYLILEKDEQGQCAANMLSIDLLQPGIHRLSLVETLRTDIDSATVQYRTHMQWHDAEKILDPPEGTIELAFDTSSLVPEEIAAVRVKIVDAAGIEYHSNSVLFNPPVFTAAMGCIPEGSLAPAVIAMDVSLAEALQTVKIQVESMESGGVSWKDFAEYGVFDGFPYQFAAPYPEGLPEGSGYPLRFVGMGESGRLYISNELSAPPKQCTKLAPKPPIEPGCEEKSELYVSYDRKRKPCNSVQAGKVTMALRFCPEDEPEVLPDGVVYYLEDGFEWRLLKQFSPAVEGWGTVSIDTGGLAEGAHRVRVDLVYGDSVVRGFRTNVLIVDRILPQAEITSPSGSEPFCTRTVVNARGDVVRYADVNGNAADENGISSYCFIYGEGRNPDPWFDIAQDKPCRPEDGDCPYISIEEKPGLLGSWKITAADSREYALQFMVTDAFGNTSCVAAQVRPDLGILTLTAETDHTVISPNNDGTKDAVAVDYQVGANAVLDMTIVRDGSVVRRLAADQQIGPGPGRITWDGLDDAGITVPDGPYRVELEVRDPCGNRQRKSLPVTVDNTPPTTMILFPGSGQALRVVTEVIGTVADAHLAAYQLHALNEGSEAPPILLSAGDIFVENGLLGLWNTFGLEGEWSLILTGEDLAGNTGSTKLPVSVGTRPELIAGLQADPVIFSPDGDGEMDATEVVYELTDTANVTITVEDFAGNLVAGAANPSAPAGLNLFQWDGVDAGGNTVPDGSYRLKVTAESVSAPFVIQEEQITFVTDTVPPAIEVISPVHSSLYAGEVEVRGALGDSNLREYTVSITGGQEPLLLSVSEINREMVFSRSVDLPDGIYTLLIEAADRAGNSSGRDVSFTVDATRPRIVMESPSDEQFFGGSQALVTVRSMIEEENPGTYSVQYRQEEEPEQWVDIASGEGVPPDNVLAVWAVDPDQRIADGGYTIRVKAVDKAGWESTALRSIRIDNHPPEIGIALPENEGFVREPFDIIGTVIDPFLREYALSIASSSCSRAVNWSFLGSGDRPLENSGIAPLRILPPDGVYCLRLSAADLLENTAEQKVEFTIDTTPPAPPVLSGSLEPGGGVALTWRLDGEPDLAGFNLYRNGKKVDTRPISDQEYLDRDIDEGEYVYTVRAVDAAGWESGDSNQAVFTVDRTPPQVMIALPRDGFRVGDYVDIIGRAFSEEDFKEYRVLYGLGENPQSWRMLRTSPVPVSYGMLVRWDAINLADGLYTLRLEAEDLSGNVNRATASVIVDNTPPAPPVLLSASADGPSVTLAWQGNTEADLAGYLVFRDGQLANASGTVIGDPAAFLITGLGYEDEGVPDGTHDYFLVAMDSAGNMSDQSNVMQVSINTRPPHLDIVAPEAGLRFDAAIAVRAESEDADIALAQFQYQASEAAGWTDFGPALGVRPYAVHLEPWALGWEFGVYRLRAVATDQAGLTDAAPQEIEITFTDVTPPAAPAGLTARVNGGFITLSWNEGSEADLAGFNVYLGSTPQPRNPDLVTETTFVEPAGSDTGFGNGEYQFAVTAVDAAGNESEKASINATVFTPVLLSLPSVVTTPDVTAEGHTVPEAAVEIVSNTGMERHSLGTAQADVDGRFSLAVSLDEGVNVLAALATDSAGNISRPSNVRTVVYDPPPAAPTGLAAEVSGYDVLLSWDANTESDLQGYRLYRNGERINSMEQVVTGSFSASANSSRAHLAADNDPETYWNSSSYPAAFGPVWWNMSFGGQVFLSSIEIEWGGVESGRLMAGKDYEIQVLTGGAWQEVAGITDNSAKRNAFEFEPPVKAEGVRLYITASTDSFSYKTVRIDEVRVSRETLITGEAYEDQALADGEYAYQVSAVDAFGSESPLTPAIQVVIGDVIPPAPPRNLVVSAAGSDCLLAWQANSEPDLAGYNVYRASAAGWLKLNPAPVAAVDHIDAGLKNGAYTYRVTALDRKGNESAPSNDGTAVIAQEPPAPPSNLVAAAAAEGRAVDLCWNSSPDPVAGYHIYRSLIPGGPYARVSGNPVQEGCYRDSGLTDGTEYFYVARAVDSFGNESVDSNEDSATPQDHAAPGKPILLLPTVTGRPYDSPAARIDVGGIAEAGAIVDLVLNHQWTDTAQAPKEAAWESSFLTAHRAFETVATPDGRSVYFVLTENTSFPYSYYTFRKDLPNGEEVRIDRIPEGSWNHLVSPDGTRVVYCYDNGPGSSRIGIYDRTADRVAPLTTAADVAEYDPAWSRDGRKIVFDSDRGDGVYDIWIHDLAGNRTSRVTDHFEGFYPRISADGQKVAFHAWNHDTGKLHLYLTDAGGGTPLLLADDVDWSGYYPSVDWSPQGGKLAFTANLDGVYDIHVHDAATGETTRLTETETIEVYPQWSPDGGSIAYYAAAGIHTEVRVLSAGLPAEDRLLHSFAGGVASDFNWLPAGIFYRSDTDLHRIITPGTFLFRDVGLRAGQNIFTAMAEDEAGNVSQPADAILVNLDAAGLPDLEVRDQDIFILPDALLMGEEAIFNIRVRNGSSVQAENISVEIYLRDAEENMELIHTETIPFLGAYAEEWLSVRWDGADRAGTRSIIVQLDPDNEIVETEKGNNAASRDFHIAEEIGLSFDTMVNGGEFTGGEIVSIAVAMHNSGQETDVRLGVTIEDEAGFQVEELTVLDQTLPYGGSRKVELEWQAGSVLAGTYRVRAVLTDAAAGFVGEQIRPFTILPDIDVGAVLTADKVQFGPDEDVLLDLDVTNKGSNAILPVLHVRFSITDNLFVHFAEEQTLPGLYPMDSARLGSSWNTGSTPPGRYTASVEVFLDGERVASDATELVIVPVMELAGKVTAEPGVVHPDGMVGAGYTITGGGNVEAGAVLLRIRVIETRSWTTVTAHEENVILGAGQTVSGRHEFGGRHWTPGLYQVVLEAVRQNDAENLAVDTFTVRDVFPPALSVLSPLDGSILNEGFDLSATAVDDTSGVAKVEYQVDDGAWLPLPAVNSSPNRYASRWLPGEADEGPHTIRFRAGDYAGNMSQPAVSTIVISPRVIMAAAADRTSCGMDEDLTITVDLDNLAWRKHVHLAVAVETSEGGLVAPLADEDLILESGARQTRRYTWRTGTADAGAYRVRTTLVKNGGVLAEQLVAFAIKEVLALEGTLHLPVSPVPCGDPVTVGWSVSNNGNFDITGLAVEMVLTSPSMARNPVLTETIALLKGQTVSGSLPLATDGMMVGDYELTLKARHGAGELVLAAAGFELADSQPPVVSIISPLEGTVVEEPVELAVSVTDDATGVEMVEYRINQGEWRRMPAGDPASNFYAVLWTPAEEEDGRRIISFRGRDRAGNISEPVAVGVVVELCSGFADLEGMLRVSPSPLYYSQDAVFDYTVVNRCGKTLDSLDIRVAVHDDAADSVINEAVTTSRVAPRSSVEGSLELSTLELQVGPYRAVLEVSQPDGEARKLAEDSFEVLPAVEGDNSPLDRTNLLVWLNSKPAGCAADESGGGRGGEKGQGDGSPHQQRICGPGCSLDALLENVFEQAADYTMIACSRDEFERELRNPFYTDILIIGNRQQLTDHHDRELREKVYSGTGLISLGWNVPGDHLHDDGSNGHHDHHDAFLGVTARGVLPPQVVTITLAESAVAGAGAFTMEGQPVLVETAENADIVAWFIDGCGHGGGSGARKNNRECDSPAIVLHEYGLGRTVYAAFDPCEARDDANGEQLAELLRKAVEFVHQPGADPDHLVPHQIRSYAVEMASPGLDLDLELRIECPPDILIFDPLLEEWIVEYPWIVTFPLQAGGSVVVPYDVLAPDREGVFTCELNAGFAAGGQFVSLQKTAYALIVAKDRARRLDEVITTIAGFSAAGRERAQRDNALRFLRSVEERTVLGGNATEMNMRDIGKAVDALLHMDRIDTHGIRLQLDTLLRIEQGRWYLYE